MLFSEPKIPQLPRFGSSTSSTKCFSALQRAENSSTEWQTAPGAALKGFSALQRAENSSTIRNSGPYPPPLRFSALQRAENSSICQLLARGQVRAGFQCSSASRKFLNAKGHFVQRLCEGSFSALQRAENSSIPRAAPRSGVRKCVSVLFSEPKIPQGLRKRSGYQPDAVSVLFSEPKIPQLTMISSASVR